MVFNNSFRGFGGPQGLMVTEMMIDEVADQLGIDKLEIRKKNLYKLNDRTHIDMPIEDWYVPEMLDELLKRY